MDLLPPAPASFSRARLARPIQVYCGVGGLTVPVDWCVSSPGPFYTLANASTWFIVAFTVERCVLVRFPLLKLRLCTPRNAGLCCGSLLVLAFVKNIDLFFINDLVVGTDLRCTVTFLGLCEQLPTNDYLRYVLCDPDRCRDCV